MTCPDEELPPVDALALALALALAESESALAYRATAGAASGMANAVSRRQNKRTEIFIAGTVGELCRVFDESQH